MQSEAKNQKEGIYRHLDSQVSVGRIGIWLCVLNRLIGLVVASQEKKNQAATDGG